MFARHSGLSQWERATIRYINANSLNKFDLVFYSRSQKEQIEEIHILNTPAGGMDKIQ